MKYMLLIYQDQLALTDNERQACYKEVTEFAHELKAQSRYLAASPLMPVIIRI